MFRCKRFGHLQSLFCTVLKQNVASDTQYLQVETQFSSGLQISDAPFFWQTDTLEFFAPVASILSICGTPMFSPFSGLSWEPGWLYFPPPSPPHTHTTNSNYHIPFSHTCSLESRSDGKDAWGDAVNVPKTEHREYSTYLTWKNKCFISDFCFCFCGGGCCFTVL